MFKATTSDKTIAKSKNAIMRIYIQKQWDLDKFQLLFRAISWLYRFKFWVSIANEIILEYEYGEKNKPQKIKFASFNQTPLGIKLNRQLETVTFEIRTAGLTHIEQIHEKGYSRSHIEVLWLDKRINSFLPNLLNVLKIKYSSPGFTDIVGLSGIFKQIKELFFHYRPNEENKEKTKLLRQKRIAIEIDNLKKIGFSDAEVKKIISELGLYEHCLGYDIKNKRITDIEITSIE